MRMPRRWFVWCTPIALALLGLWGLWVVDGRRVVSRGIAVQQLLMASLAYPSGRVMAWPASMPELVRWSQGELDAAWARLEPGRLAYPRPDARSAAEQPALVYEVDGLWGARYVVAYCNGDVQVTRDARIHAVARRLAAEAGATGTVDMAAWRRHLPELGRR